MAKRKQPRKTKNSIIEILKIMREVELVTVPKLVEDTGLYRGNILNRLRDLEEAGLVECVGEFQPGKFFPRSPLLWRLTISSRSTQYETSGTPGPACHTNTNSRHPEITHNYDQTCVQSNSDVVL